MWSLPDRRDQSCRYGLISDLPRCQRMPNELQDSERGVVVCHTLGPFLRRM